VRKKKTDSSGELPIKEKRGLFVPMTVGMVLVLILGISSPYGYELYRLRYLPPEERSFYNEWKHELPNIQREHLIGEPPSDDFVETYEVMIRYYNLLFDRPFLRMTNFYQVELNEEEVPEKYENLRRHPFEPFVESFKEVVNHPDYNLEYYVITPMLLDEKKIYIDDITLLMMNNILYDFIHDNSDQAFEDLEVLKRCWQPADFPGGGSFLTCLYVQSLCNTVLYLEKYHPDVYEKNKTRFRDFMLQIREDYKVEDHYRLRNLYKVDAIRKGVLLGKRTPSDIPENFEELTSVQVTAIMINEDISPIYPWDKPYIYQRVRWIYLEEEKWVRLYQQPFNLMDELIEDLAV